MRRGKKTTVNRDEVRREVICSERKRDKRKKQSEEWVRKKRKTGNRKEVRREVICNEKKGGARERSKVRKWERKRKKKKDNKGIDIITR